MLRTWTSHDMMCLVSGLEKGVVAIPSHLQAATGKGDVISLELYLCLLSKTTSSVCMNS